ncbi:MAG TPA: hypothetical protein PKA00_14175 [Saprospiraceae bacterium]|nr:hypothetical protein [Saprospiraceae bacterium]HMQ84059.1 hypothetical protein [Saprospiraceae bacterium]
MKNRLLIFAFLWIGAMPAWAQSVAEYTLEKGIKGLVFDSMEVMKYELKPDGIRLYLELKRQGAVQEKIGPVYSGGKDAIWVNALGVLDFTPDLKLVQEELVFIKPDRVVAKQYNLLAKPGKVADPDNIMATQDNCLDVFAVLEKYPALTEEAENTASFPASYYANTVDYSLLGGKPKSLTLSKMTLKATDAKKSLFQEIVGTSRYGEENKKIELEPYRGSTNKDYWIRESDPVCDPKSGVFLAHHGHIIWGQMGNKSNLFEQEMVAYNEDGTEINRTEIKFDLPHELAMRQVFVKESPSDNLYQIDGVVHIYGQAYGLGYKKLNPTPDKMAYKLYYWNGDGGLLYRLDFARPTEDFKFLRAFQSGSNLSVLGSSRSDNAFYSLQFSDGKLVSSEKLDADINKGISFTPAEIAGLDWHHIYAYDRPEGERLTIHELKNTVTQTGTTNTMEVSKGFLLVKTDKNGAIQAARGIKSSPQDNPAYKPYFKVYESGNGGYSILWKAWQMDGSAKTTIFTLDAQDLELKEIAQLSNAQQVSIETLSDKKTLMVFSADLKRLLKVAL